MRITPLDASAFSELARTTLRGELPFGRVFTPHMAVMEYDSDQGWHGGRVQRREALVLDPAAMCLHYGQTVFEGLKAHRQQDGKVVLFRPGAHAERLQRSCQRLCIPPVAVEAFLSAVESLVATDYAWVPDREGTSLYVRPTIIATEPALGVRPSLSYLFYVIASATGPYFAGGLRGIRVAIERNMTRAAPGGLGGAKAGANYVASMLAAERAKQAGCAQVLWLDAIEHRWIEETGASNVFWVHEGVLCTSPLGDTVLGGITRDCVMNLAPSLGLKVQERRIAADDLLEGIRKGTITEVFGTGTAAVVAPIAEVWVDGEVVRVADGQPGKVSTLLLDTITAIHRGRRADAFGWCTVVPKPVWL